MIEAAQHQAASLRGRRVLVVEDEYLIAEEIAGELAEAGAEVLGPVSQVGEALRLIGGVSRIDLALLDVTLGDETIWPVVDALLARGVPLMLATGYDAAAVPQAYGRLARHEKPVSGRDLVRALARMLASEARA